MAGKHRKPVKPLWPAATGVTLAAVSLLTSATASHPPVARVAAQAPLEPVRFAFPPLSTAEAALYLPPLPQTPPAPVQVAPVESVAHEAAEVVKAPEHLISAATTAVSAAISRKGTPYVYGGAAPGGFDCSGLMQWAFRQAGISLPRTAAAQAGVGRRVSLSELQPGDLLYYYSPIDHVVMYVGNGQIVEASQPGTTVHVRPMYTQGLVEARRIT